MQLLAGRLPLPACPSRSLALQSTAGPRAVASKADRGQQASLRPPAPPPHRAACRCAAALAAPHRPCCTTPDDDLPLEDVAAWAPLQPDYALGHEVGRGSFATVLEVTDTRTGERLAAKKLPKCRHHHLPEEQAAAVAAEAATQAALGSASTHVLRLRDVRQSGSSYFLISDLCRCDLAAHLSGRLQPVGEREAAHIAAQLLAALSACHRAGVAYRDVKPANLLVRGLDASGLPQVVLADFGCSRSVTAHSGGDRTSAGTPLYSAPESMQGTGAGMAGDVWGAGVLLYSLLSGAFPFCDPRHNITQGEYWRRVAEQPIHYAGPAWQHVSPGAVALLRRMLDRDCSRRISAAAALQDPWLLALTSSPGGGGPPASPRGEPAGNVLPGSPLSQQRPHPLAAAPAPAPQLHAGM